MRNGILAAAPLALLKQVLKYIYHRPLLQKQLGFHTRPYSYDCPISNPLELDLSKLQKRHAVGNCAMSSDSYAPMLTLLAQYAPEIHSLPIESNGSSPFWFKNYGYGDADAATLYGLIRHLKPSRLVEAGSGYSSMLISMAILKNQTEGHPCAAIHVEPYPGPHLLSFDLAGDLKVQKLEECETTLFESLKENDILFIDSTHVLKAQSDLVFLFNEVLPKLASGVYVHFHDVYTPYDFTEELLFQRQFTWNEQYAIEALIANSDRFEVALPLYCIWKESRHILEPLVPWGSVAPAAFWLRRK